MQDILRIMQMRTMVNGVQKVQGADDLNPGSNDDGFKIVGTGAADVTVKAGTLLCDGLPIPKAADSTLTGFVVPGADRIDTVYMAITELEVTDPAQIPQLGETTRRRKLSYALAISVTGEAGVPASTPQEIWEGGIRYFKLANIQRYAGVAGIQAADVTDLRKLLPPSIIAEITRQQNGHVAALVGSTLETPDGTLLPESASMFFDVDPADSFAGTRAFAWTWARDAAVRTPASLVETPLVTGKTAAFLLDSLTVILSEGYLSLSDASQVTSPGSKYIPLTDNVVDYLRVGGTPGATGETIAGLTPTTSVARSLNSRAGVSVGDGVNSFGDFNGADAIRDAWLWSSSQATGPVSIFVKRGSYTLNTGDIISDTDVVIIGVDAGAESVTISVTANDALVINGATLHLENIELVRSGATTTVFSHNSEPNFGFAYQKCVVRNCIIRGRVILTSPEDEVLFERCIFDLRRDAITGVSCVRVDVTGPSGVGETNYFGRVVFRDCRFSNNTRAVTEFSRSIGLTGHQILGDFTWERCRFDLAGTTATGSLATNNVGVVDFLGGNALPLSGNFTSIRSLRWLDCSVRANCLGDPQNGGAYSAVSTLIKLTGYPNGITNGDASPFTQLTDIWEVEIRGGRWTCPTTPTTFSPFVISLATATHVVIEDTYIGFDGATVQGGPETDVVPFFAGGASTPSRWSAFVFATGSVTLAGLGRPTDGALRMTGVRLSGGDASTVGDVLIGTAGKVDIDGLTISGPGEAAGGGGSNPAHRVKFIAGNNISGDFVGAHRVRGLTLRNPGTVFGVGDAFGVVMIEPNIAGLTIEDAVITGPGGGATLTGIVFAPRANNDRFENISFIRCRVHGHGRGVALSTGVALTGVVFENIEFIDCVITENQGIGIDLNPPAPDVLLRDLVLRGCKVNLNTGIGVRIRSENWTNFENVLIEHNRITNNNGGVAAVQMHIEDTSGAGYPRPIIMGNKFSEGSVSRGILKVTRGGGAALITPRGFDNPLAPSVYGAQTGHSITDAQQYHFTSGDGMIHNDGALETP